MKRFSISGSGFEVFYELKKYEFNFFLLLNMKCVNKYIFFCEVNEI